MGLQWGVQFCPQAQMLIKIDDDTAINLPQLLALAPPLLKNETLIGAISNGAGPQRSDSWSKWIVSLEEWPSSVYPEYLLGYISHNIFPRPILGMRKILILFLTEMNYNPFSG
jgi:Galactosyltransferase